MPANRLLKIVPGLWGPEHYGGNAAGGSAESHRLCCNRKAGGASQTHRRDRAADPKLLRVFRPYCDAAATERGAKPGALRSPVEAEVEKLLPHGKAKAENVVKVFGQPAHPSREDWLMKADA